jgi:hypothetical protein
MFDLFSDFIMTTTHETLYAGNRVDWVGYCLTFCRIAYFPFSIFQKCNHTGRGSSAFIVGDHDWFISFHYGYATIGCSEVYSNDFCHISEFRYTIQAIAMPMGKSGKLVSLDADFVPKIDFK